VSEGGAHPKTNVCSPVNSQFGAGRDCGRGPVDSVDHNRLCRIAGADRGDSLLRLVELHGQPGWVAALTPFSVDGMIVAASTTLLADSRTGRRGGLSPWTLLVADSVASLAANVAVAEPTLICRVIAAWPSFALTASYELLTVRSAAALPNSAPAADGRGSSGQQHRRPPNLHPPLRRSCGWSARPSWVRGTAIWQVLICSGVPGSGH
jgi:Protein of unknown function (DUF2637)